MSFPNADWQEEQDAPRWKPVAGKPNVYVHDDNPKCEAEIYRVECAPCGTHALVMHAVCTCDDHQSSDVSLADRVAAHEACPSCGDRMGRLEVPEDGSWPGALAL